MVSPNIEKVLQEAKSLDLAEREQFIELLKLQPAPGEAQSKEDQLTEALLRKGIIRKATRKPTPADVARWQQWEPLRIEGQPLSQTIIEERR